MARHGVDPGNLAKAQNVGWQVGEVELQPHYNFAAALTFHLPLHQESLLLREEGDVHLAESFRGKKVKIKPKTWSKSHSQTPGFCQL